eukprot:SAG11_NODE_2333_length_3504_cov_54.934508_1_plen_76_part_00
MEGHKSYRDNHGDRAATEIEQPSPLDSFRSTPVWRGIRAIETTTDTQQPSPFDSFGSTPVWRGIRAIDNVFGNLG